LTRSSDNITAKDLLGLIPEDKFASIIEDTKVDYQVKKLFGRSMFYLLLYGLLEGSHTSLRSLAELFNSYRFKVIFHLLKDVKTKFNSISDRLSTMNVDFFREVYELLYKEFSNYYNHTEGIKYNITRVDSTMVTEASNKLKSGMVVGPKGKDGPKRIKFTMSLTNLLPSSIEIYTDQKFLSEDKAIPLAIHRHLDKRSDNVFVFDRGVSSRAAFNKLDDSSLCFVTRVNPNCRHEIISSTTISETRIGNLDVKSDQRVILFDKHNKKSNEFRLIKTVDEEGKPLWFISNLFEDEIDTIIKIYKKRWDIEVYFRFLKQELNLKHFISTSINGIQIILYMTMILSMLVLMYKKANGYGYREAKRKLYYEVDELFAVLLAVILGGDPNLVFR
jgi:hypothetical protein